MKQKLLISLFALLAVMTARADVRINSTNFPDPNFRNWLLEQEFGADGKLTNEEIAEIDFLDVSGKNIKSLGGIRFFTALEELDCSNNELTALNVSGCTALTWIACWGNQIRDAAMDVLVESLPSAVGGSFYVINNENEQNKISTVQVAAAKVKGWTPMFLDDNWNWQEYAGNVPDITIDAENFPDTSFRNWLFKQEYGVDGVLTSEEIANVTSIIFSYENVQDLKGIEFFTALTTLKCQYNKLTALDVSKNTALTELNCGYNQLMTLDVSQNAALIRLDCFNNQLMSLDVSKNTKLTYLSCHDNQLTTLDVSGCTALESLYCYGNKIKGAKMDALVESLPYSRWGKIYVFSMWEEANEGNVMTTTQVAAAKEKGWTPMCSNDYWSGYWFDYTGSEPGNSFSISNIPEGWKVNGNTVTGGSVTVEEGDKVTFTPANIPAGKKVKSIKVVKKQ